MRELKNWQKGAISQRNPRHGCIPTGYERILRIAGIEGLDFKQFQEEFNLDRIPRNNFESVATVINQRYPHVVLKSKDFKEGEGEDKVKFVRELVQKDTPCLISLALSENGGWHIVPVIAVDSAVLIVMWDTHPVYGPLISHIPIDLIVKIHNEWNGGKEVAWVGIT